MRIWRYTGLLVLIGLGALVVYGRCQQMEGARARNMQRGLAALAEALATGDGDFTEAESAFRRAARESLGDPYPHFCFSAVRELLGQRVGPEPPPAGWTEALDALAGGALQEARSRFEAIQSADPVYVQRAAFYLRLLDDLEAVRAAGAEP